MKGSVGDRVYLASSRPGHARVGCIVALRHPDGTPPYVVRWSDTGHDEVYFPRNDGLIETVDPPEPHEVRDVDLGGVTKRWTVEVQVTESGDTTSVRAILHEGPEAGVVTASGFSFRHPRDPDIPEIGDEVAVARALRRLSDTLLTAAGMPDSEAPPVDLTDASAHSRSGPVYRSGPV